MIKDIDVMNLRVGEGLKCLAECAAESYIGVDIASVTANAGETVVLEALEKGFRDSGMKVALKATKLAGGLSTTYDTATFLMCSNERSCVSE